MQIEIAYSLNRRVRIVRENGRFYVHVRGGTRWLPWSWSRTERDAIASFNNATQYTS